MKTESICPICGLEGNGDTNHKDLKVCDDCKRILDPDAVEDQEYETMNINYEGFYHYMY